MSVSYRVVVHLLPQDASFDEKYQVLSEAHANKETILQSADDAARLVAPGASGSKVIAWGAQRWGGDIAQWLKDRGVTQVETRSFKVSLVTVDDITHKVARHPEWGKKSQYTYGSRPLVNVTVVTIHHSAGSTDPYAIASYHVSRGWPGPGYHYCVSGSGHIWQLNKLEWISYHTAYNNHYSVGICLLGNFQINPPPQRQLDAARNLVAHLRGVLSGVNDSKGHKDMPFQSTACPGNTYGSWLSYITGKPWVSIPRGMVLEEVGACEDSALGDEEEVKLRAPQERPDYY